MSVRRGMNTTKMLDPELLRMARHGKIRSQPSSAAYRDGWERTFGKKPAARQPKPTSRSA